MFSEMKPGEDCNFYICLMMAAAALAKPMSELPARGPGRELGSVVGAWALLCRGQPGWGAQLSQGAGKGGAGLLDGSSSCRRLGSFLLSDGGEGRVLRVLQRVPGGGWV